MRLLIFTVMHRVSAPLMAAMLVCCPASALAMEQDGNAHHGHQHGGTHAAHQAQMQQQGYTRKEHAYEIPEVSLTDQDGRKVSLRDMLESEKPVLLNFIFTTCTTICPVLSASFARTQRILGVDYGDMRMISISIDPEHDTPDKLREYAQRFQAREGWSFLTGDLGDIVAVLKAFDAYRGDKMNHIPLTFLRASPEASWIRLEGFASANEIASEYRAMTLPADIVTN